MAAECERARDSRKRMQDRAVANRQPSMATRLRRFGPLNRGHDKRFRKAEFRIGGQTTAGGHGDVTGNRGPAARVRGLSFSCQFIERWRSSNNAAARSASSLSTSSVNVTSFCRMIWLEAALKIL